MVTIEDIKKHQYLLCIDSSTFYSRLIIKLARMTWLSNDFDVDYYELVAVDGATYKLYHNLKDNNLSVDCGRANLLSVKYATSNFIELIEEGDVITYKNIDKGGDDDSISAKVVKYQEQYQRFIIEICGERHNLSTLLKKYGTAKIFDIKTFDLVKYNAMIAQ